MPERCDARLNAVRRYDALDWAGDHSLDRMTRLAAAALQAPVATLSFVYRNHIRYGAQFGIDDEKARRLPGFCDTTVTAANIHYVRDVAVDPVARTHPLVTGPTGIRFYAAAPLRTHDGLSIGALCVMDRKPRELAESDAELLTQLASIVMGQLDLQLTSDKVAKLEQQERILLGRLKDANSALAESEERFRDLFDEAPFAYVHEDIDSRFIRANRTAIRTLGLKPEEAVGTLGITLVADTEEAQRRVKEALASVESGTDTSGVVLEMRRKDNGEPVWIEWWSRPAPDGSYTRTMFIDITERVLMRREKERLEAQNTYLQEEIRQSHFDEIIGESKQMLQIFADVQQVAPTTATVLILGETGTGKELIARAVHKSSDRADMPLIKVNCSALPSSLIESELFGHEKGAFTGATAKRDGRFSLADGGTIFLDEIADLPIELQAKLLRVLQEGEFEPLGSSQTRKVNVRVIAATNRDLREATQKGEFREDLYFRLAVFPITLPPLRERLGDLASLATLFAGYFADRLGREPIALSAAEIERLASYSWPGNVRELKNVIERALITSHEGALNLDRALPESAGIHLPPTGTGNGGGICTAAQLQELERDNMRLALETAGWRISGKGGAAELLDMKPSTLSSRIKALAIQRNQAV